MISTITMYLSDSKQQTNTKSVHSNDEYVRGLSDWLMSMMICSSSNSCESCDVHSGNDPWILDIESITHLTERSTGYIQSIKQSMSYDASNRVKYKLILRRYASNQTNQTNDRQVCATDLELWCHTIKPHLIEWIARWQTQMNAHQKYKMIGDHLDFDREHNTDWLFFHRFADAEHLRNQRRSISGLVYYGLQLVNDQESKSNE